MTVRHVEVLGQPAIELAAADGAAATVLVHGAQIVSWRPADGAERLYLSPRAVAGEDCVVRGGIPVIFPQFDRRGTTPRHGFARTRAWRVVEAECRPTHAQAVLSLAADDATRALWPHDFDAELTLSVAGATLEVELGVTNTGNAPFTFTAALHTYLRCEDVLTARLTGLRGCDYEDNARGGATQRQQIEPLVVVGEIDRIYHDVPRPVVLQCGARRIEATAVGFDDVVLWNPGPEKAAALDDLPPDDWRRLICVEAGRIAHPMTLAGGAEWVGRQSLRAS